MIYLITGVPGSGKTLYAVSTLVQKLIGETIKGKDVKDIKRRLVVDGIPDLVIPHESMAERKDDSAAVGRVGAKAGDADVEQVGHGLWNWWEWAQPGDVLVVDEVQRYWRPRGMGTKPPKEIAMLETHRHFGVDFVLITQNAMLVDQNVRRLVGRHLNVRRLFGGARALIYDWDGCQTDVHRTQGATRTVWNYPKSAYKLYKSSELHTKQQQKIPLWFAFPLVVLALAVFMGPKAYSALAGAATGKGVSAAASAASAPVVAASAPSPGVVASVVSGVRHEVAAVETALKDEPTYAGCVASGSRCTCYGETGKPVNVELAVCQSEVSGGAAPSESSHRIVAALEVPRPAVMPAADIRMIESLHGLRANRAEWGRVSAPSY